MNPAVGLIRRVVLFGLALCRSLLRWVTRRPDIPSGATGFAYVGEVAVLMWVLVGVSPIEVVGLHVILPWDGVRMGADILGICGLALLLGMMASLNVHPHLVTDTGLRIRHGAATDITVPWASIATIGVRMRSLDGSGTLQVDQDEQGNVLHVVMASQTNVDVTLRCPLVVPVGKGKEEKVMALRLYADDARGLVSKAEEHLATNAETAET